MHSYSKINDTLSIAFQNDIQFMEIIFDCRNNYVLYA